MNALVARLQEALARSREQRRAAAVRQRLDTRGRSAGSGSTAAHLGAWGGGAAGGGWDGGGGCGDGGGGGGC